MSMKQNANTVNVITQPSPQQQQQKPQECCHNFNTLLPRNRILLIFVASVSIVICTMNQFLLLLISPATMTMNRSYRRPIDTNNNSSTTTSNANDHDWNSDPTILLSPMTISSPESTATTTTTITTTTVATKAASATATTKSSAIMEQQQHLSTDAQIPLHVATAAPITAPAVAPVSPTPIAKIPKANPVQIYKNNVLAVNQSKPTQLCMKFRHEFNEKYIPSMQPVVSCLQHTYPQQQQQQQQGSKTKTSFFNLSTLHYPVDAEIHYNNIRYAMAQFAQHRGHRMHNASGYSGPWIENVYISHFEGLFDNVTLQQQSTNTAKRTMDEIDLPGVLCLNDVFGPYIPIFLPWVDHLINNRYQYPKNMINTLKSVLRPNVAYIVVSQNAGGLNNYENAMNLRQHLPNIVVLSAGGHGHVPIPLLKQNEVLERNKIPMQHRPIDVSYVGSLKNAPHNARPKMNDRLTKLFNTIDGSTLEQLIYNYTLNNHTTNPYRIHPPTTSVSDTNSTLRDNNPAKILKRYTYAYYYGKDWRKVMQLSKYSLVPRGYGRTAYHLVEAIQMGFIPIMIYLNDDIPWIPYYNSIYKPHIGYDVSFAQLPHYLSQLLSNNTSNDLEQREKRIESFISSHFQFDAILQQIQYFMLSDVSSTSRSSFDYRSSLECQALPLHALGYPR